MDGNKIAAMIDTDRIIFKSYEISLGNERICEMVEHAIDYLSQYGSQFYVADVGEMNDVFCAVDMLYEAHKAIGPMGQIPSWESKSNGRIRQ